MKKYSLLFGLLLVLSLFGCAASMRANPKPEAQAVANAVADASSCECTAPSEESSLEEAHSDEELGLTCDLRAPRIADWDLSTMNPVVVAFFSELSRSENMSVSVLLGEVADSYFKRQYSFEEFQGTLLSFKALISSKHPKASHLMLDSEDQEGENLRLGNSIIIYIDPLCEHCKKVLDLLVKASEVCPSEAPRIVVRLLPSSSEGSRDAAAVLDLIKAEKPDQYLAACVKFLSVLSGSSGTLDELAREYLGGRLYRESSEFRRSRKRVNSVYDSFPGNEEGAPLVVFRGRILRKDPSRDFPFDPLKDWKMLLLTVRLVNNFDTLETEGDITRSLREAV
jgi:hypothetical protein